MFRNIRVLFPGLLILTVHLSACGGDSADTNAADTAAVDAGAATPAVTPNPEVSAEMSLTVADIDRWQRGMTAELAAVREAGVKFKGAKSATDSMSAMMAANETSTRAAGARAVGVDENRYGLLSSTMSSIVRYMAPLEAEFNVKDMPADMLTSMKKDREQTFERLRPAFPPAVIDALRPRATELRKQELALTFERLKAAGMGG